MRAIVTGAASGIGQATARLFASDPGAALFLVDRDRDRLDLVAQEVRASGAEAHVHVADLADPAAPRHLVGQAVAALGGLDTLISNAGAIHRFALTDLAPEAFDLLMAVNVRATLLLGQAAHPHLKASRGTIIATASSAADHPAIPLGAYSASKAALIMLVRQMAGEWGPDGIRCNCVSPGPTHTAMTAAAYDDPAIRAARGADIPLGRVNSPDDLARAIRFLAGPEAGQISGINLRVDGGLDAVLGVAKSGAANRI